MSFRSLVARTLLFATTLAGTAALGLARATACSIDPCDPPAVVPAGGPIPVNQFLPAFRPARDRSGLDGGSPTPRLYRVPENVRVDVPFDLVGGTGGSFTIRPREPLKPGMKVILEADAPSCAPTKQILTEYTLTEPQPVPEVLGTLEASVVRKPLQVSVSNGSCADVIDASYADLTVRTSSEMAPFAAALRYQLVLDGAAAPIFASSFGRGDAWDAREPGSPHARVYAVCQVPDQYVSPSSSVPLGVHRAKMIATLPDGTVRETPEMQFELRCDSPAPAPGWEDLGANGADRPTPAGENSDSQIGGGGCALGARKGGFGALVPALFIAAATLSGRRRRRG